MGSEMCIRDSLGAELSQQVARLDFARTEHYSASVTAGFDQPASVTFASHQDPRSITQGVYASLRWRRKAFDGEIGGRLDRQDYGSYGTHLQGSPRFNARYDLTPAWHVYGSWGEFTQAQRPDEWRTEENQRAPDPATRASHLIGGVAFDAPQTSQWRLEAYRNHWSSLSPYFDNSLNLASLVPELEPDRIRVAPQDAETAGVELSARRRFDLHLDGWATYSVSRTTDDLHGVDVVRSWDQTHAATLGLAWRNEQSSASLTLNWHSGWPKTAVALATAMAATSPGIVLGPRNGGRWSDYFAADLRVARELSFWSGDLSLWIDATNVTNHANECCSQFGAADQSGALPQVETLRWRPRELNVGFSWRVRRN